MTMMMMPRSALVGCLRTFTAMTNSSSKVSTFGCRVYTGPMFSGKTTSLIKDMNQYASHGRRVLAVKYKGDNRYSASELATHNGPAERRQNVILKCTTNLTDLLEIVDNFDVICIDEGQFYNDLHYFLETVKQRSEAQAEKKVEKLVIIAALDLDYRRVPFKSTVLAHPYVTEPVPLTAICGHCQKPALYTFRTSSDTDQQVIGGSEIYQPLCKSCYDKASGTGSNKGNNENLPL